MEHGNQPGGLFPGSSAGYRWARRYGTWRKPNQADEPILLNMSRSTDSIHRGDSASIAIFFGDENDVTEPSCQLAETELRELLVAIGCTWAAIPTANGS